MSDELNLPKPPDGYFWRITRSAMSTTYFALRKKTFWYFSREVNYRILLPSETTTDVLISLANDMLRIRREREAADRMTTRFEGDYYRD